MQQTRPVTEEEVRLLEAQSTKIKGRREYRRLQSILYRAKDGKTAEEIALLLGIHSRTVEKHHQRYFKQGLKAFESLKTGPKGSRLLKKEEEIELFNSLKAQAAEGQLINAAEIKARFEEKLGKTCAKSTIYGVLKRNHWSKKQPRPRHPKGNDEAKCLLLRNSDYVLQKNYLKSFILLQK